jgi:hypothetical protein
VVSSQNKKQQVIPELHFIYKAKQKAAENETKAACHE